MNNLCVINESYPKEGYINLGATNLSAVPLTR